MPARDAGKPGETPGQRRLTLAELLVDAEASERLTRETLWLQEIPAVSTEID